MAAPMQVVYGFQKNITDEVGVLMAKNPSALTKADEIDLTKGRDFTTAALYVLMFDTSEHVHIWTRDYAGNEACWAIKGQGNTPVDLVIPVPPAAIFKVTDLGQQAITGGGSINTHGMEFLLLGS